MGPLMEEISIRSMGSFGINFIKTLNKVYWIDLGLVQFQCTYLRPNKSRTSTNTYLCIVCIYSFVCLFITYWFLSLHFKCRDLLSIVRSISYHAFFYGFFKHVNTYFFLFIFVHPIFFDCVMCLIYPSLQRWPRVSYYVTYHGWRY